MEETEEYVEVDDTEEEEVEADMTDCSMCSDFGTEMAFWC